MHRRSNDFGRWWKVNVLSIDLESWVHKYHSNEKSALKNKKDAGYICEATSLILDHLKKHDIKTTFFIISEVFDWHPDLIYKIKEHGHEIGFHTHTHRLLLHRTDLLTELAAGKDFIDEFDTKGFRAPKALIKRDYLAILKDWGFTYDSSIYSKFGILTPLDGFIEVPISTFPLIKSKAQVTYPRNLSIRLMMREIPFGSGYFYGLLGSNVGWFIDRLNKKNVPAILFIHPWQIKETPRIKSALKGNIPNRLAMIPYNINRCDSLDILLAKHDFVPMINVINRYGFGNGGFDSMRKGEN
jgi:peptidoglycan/xylan/chitin deacetylase (PgdA/CDA1 family)